MRKLTKVIETLIMTISISRETPERLEFEYVTNEVDPQKYVEFVNAVTSQPSKDNEVFVTRIKGLQEQVS